MTNKIMKVIADFRPLLPAQCTLHSTIFGDLGGTKGERPMKGEGKNNVDNFGK